MTRIIILCFVMLILSACSTAATPESMPNSASVYCEEQGYTFEIHTAEDGSQSGICVFPDGSSCDEWAYFRGECSPAVQESPTPAEQQSSTPAIPVEATTEGSGGYMPPGTSEPFADWWGMIKSTDAGAQFDDYFERQDLGQPPINFGIDSLDPAIKSQIEALRDSGQIVHLYGTLFSNVPDYNGSQVQVDRIEVDE